MAGTATFHEPVVDAKARVIALEFDQDKLLREVYRPQPQEAQYRVVENLSPDDLITTVWTRDGRQKLDEVAFHFHRRHGRAQGWHPNGQPRYQGQWQDDRAVGKWIVWNEAGQVAEELEFTAGRLQTRAGQPLADYRDLIPFLQQSGQHRAAVAESLLLQPLMFPAPSTSSGAPLQDALAAVPQDVWNPPPYVGSARQTITELTGQLHAVIDRSVSSEARTSLLIDFPYHGLPSDAALYLALHPLGLTCEYRYEHLWITTLDAAKTWQRSPAMPQLPPVNPSPTGPRLANDGIPALYMTLEYLTGFWQRSLGVSIRLGETPAAAEALGAIKVDEFKAGISLDAQLATVCELHNLQYAVDGDEIIITARKDKDDAKNQP